MTSRHLSYGGIYAHLRPGPVRVPRRVDGVDCERHVQGVSHADRKTGDWGLIDSPGRETDRAQVSRDTISRVNVQPQVTACRRWGLPARRPPTTDELLARIAFLRVAQLSSKEPCVLSGRIEGTARTPLFGANPSTL
jgi:hypothetical protein